MNDIPCKNCVVFPICINKPVTNVLKCALTFEYFCKTAIKTLQPGTHEVILSIPGFEDRNLQVRMWNLYTTYEHRYVEISPYYDGRIVYTESLKIRIRLEKSNG